MKIATEESSKHYQLAQKLFISALHDQNDPASENLLRGLNEYFYAVGLLQVQTADLLNALYAKVDKLEKQLAAKPK